MKVSAEFATLEFAELASVDPSDVTEILLLVLLTLTQNFPLSTMRPAFPSPKPF